MADPKYADLPGIALDEPDVYETNDLPESEQTADFYEDENEPIERIHIEATEAYNKFKGKFLNATNVDFSTSLNKRSKTGYDARSGDWEISGEQKETAIQKYHRLQCEMKELLEEVNEIQKNKKDDKDTTDISAKQIENSLKTLADLKLEETLGKEIVSQISDPQGTQIQKLLSQLEQFKANIKDMPESEKQGDGSDIVYQFKYRPEQAKLLQTSRMAELEARLHRLENIMGTSDDKLSRLTAATSKGSLLETAQHLSATASLLDSSQLDHIEGRLSGLAQKLDVIREKKKEVQHEEEENKKITELYDLVKKSENNLKLVPQTIDRLKSLEGLHSKATNFAQTLAQIEMAHSEMSGNVQDNKTLLQGVQESFARNLNEINQTVISLDARIKALKKK